MRRLRSTIAMCGVLGLGLGGSMAGGQVAGAPGPARPGRGPAPSPAALGSVLPAGHTWTVTLVTGDVVRVQTIRGRPPLVIVQPGPGRRNVVFTKFVSSTGQIEVIPQDVVPRLGRTLSPALFDVTALITGRAGGAPARSRPTAHTVALTLRATALPGTAPGKMAAAAFVVNLTNPALFNGYVPIGASGTSTVRVPAGHYWVYGQVDDITHPAHIRTAVTGQPEVSVEQPVTVALDGAAAVPVSASVPGRPTQLDQATLHIERSFAGQIFGADVFDFEANPAHVLYAQPSGTASTGTFRIFATFRLASPPGRARPYVYDLYHLMGDRVPRSMTYVITPAAQATMARVLARFYAIDGNTSPFLEDRYGLTATGFLAIQNQSPVPGGVTRTDYLSTEEGIRWDQEAAPPLRIGGHDQTGLWVIEIPGFTHYAAGSVQVADWARQPFRPGPYSATRLSLSFCAPHPVIRFPGAIHVELTDLQDLPDGYDCLGGTFPLPPWARATSRTMRLYLGNRLLGSQHASVGDFLVPVAPGRYRLTYTDDTSAALPVSTRTRTTWTFSSAPARGRVVRIPLLLVNYYLPLGLDGHPDGSTAEFTVARVAGTRAARVTGFRLWTSTDNGRTWQPASVRALGGGRFTAALPRVASGQAVSLRVDAADAGGSGIEQTIMTAYHG